MVQMLLVTVVFVAIWLRENKKTIHLHIERAIMIEKKGLMLGLSIHTHDDYAFLAK